MSFRWAVVVLLSCLCVPQFSFAQATSEFNVSLTFGDNTDPPTIPSDVEVTPISASQIDVSWSSSTDLFGVAGYQVFRDMVQIATTSLTTFSDTGLAANTLYSYFIRAFDTDFLVSSSSLTVSAITFSLPTPLVATSSNQSPLSYQVPLLQQFFLDSGSEVARLDFTVNLPVTYRIEYAIVDTNKGGIVQTETFRQQHTTVLTNLLPSSLYKYELFVTDRFGRETLVRQGTFVTKDRFIVASPPNVLSFTASALGNDVMLRWVLPSTIPPTPVRIVRNARFFPNDPFDGVVVYQGSSNTFVDSGALKDFDRHYYTIFLYDATGRTSSGVVALAARTPLTVPALVSTSSPAGEESDEASVPGSTLTLRDIEFIQHDTLQTLDDSVVITRDNAFVIRVAQRHIPRQTKTVLVTLWQLEDESSLAFLLQFNNESGYYEAVIPALTRSGIYDVRLDLFDGLHERFFYQTGIIAVEDQITEKPLTPQEDSTYMSVLYIIMGGLTGMLLTLGLHRLFFLLWRRRRYQEHVLKGQSGAS